MSEKSFDTFTRSLGWQCASLNSPSASPLCVQMFLILSRRAVSSAGYDTFSSSSHQPSLSAPRPRPVYTFQASSFSFSACTSMFSLVTLAQVRRHQPVCDHAARLRDGVDPVARRRHLLRRQNVGVVGRRGNAADHGHIRIAV